MSCIMTIDREIDIIGQYVTEILNSIGSMGAIEGVKKFTVEKSVREAFDDTIGRGGKFDRRKVFHALRDLNARAFKDRYGEDPEHASPFTSFKIDLRENTRGVWQVRLFNILRFFIYQCDESVNYESRKLAALKCIMDAVAAAIANDAVKAMGLSWGDF